MSNSNQLASYKLLKGMGLDFADYLLNAFTENQTGKQIKKELEDQKPPYTKYLEDVFNTSIDAKDEIDNLLLKQNNNAATLKGIIENDYNQFLENYNKLMVLIENDKYLWTLYNKHGGFWLDYIYKWYLWFEARHLQTKINQEEHKEILKNRPQRLVFLERLGIIDFLKNKYEINFKHNQSELSKYLAHITNDNNPTAIRKDLNKILSDTVNPIRKPTPKGYTLKLLNKLGIDLEK